MRIQLSDAQYLQNAIAAIENGEFDSRLTEFSECDECGKQFSSILDENLDSHAFYLRNSANGKYEIIILICCEGYHALREFGITA